jgi:hypothetical protein
MRIKLKGVVTHTSGPQAENDIAENGLLYRRRITGQSEHCEQDLADYSNLYFRLILDSYMVAILTIGVSQAICATL